MTTPVIYLLSGDDEFAIARFVAELESKVGDPGTAAMNITRLDGRTFNPEELLSVAATMPFLARRRLVILTNPLARLNNPAQQERFLAALDQVPASTGLALIEYRLLSTQRKGGERKLHWLEEWAAQHEGRVFRREFVLPRGSALVPRFQDQARQLGGELSLPAARRLAELVDDPRLADQELSKLLAYVNYKRAIELEDVEHLIVNSREAEIFGMVDAMGNQDGKQALGLLHRLLESQDAISIFGMVVRQFRLLLLAREVLEAGGKKDQVIAQLKVAPFVADKIMAQARRFETPALEGIYFKLAELDQAIKTGQISGEVGLETFVVAVTSQTAIVT